MPSDLAVSGATVVRQRRQCRALGLRGTLWGGSLAPLLGGRRRDAIRAYATGHHFEHGALLTEQYNQIGDEAATNAELFGAVKAMVGLAPLGHAPAEDVELVARIREAVGPDVTLIVDTNYACNAATARQVGRELAGIDVY
ncbi:enolase C-terminal domain-like protein [Haloarcula nitratireducens]|uniref:Enolase C-terminal domain-containing protein n=1 Tax=Haloarcula nitratireducens TaxID=2487749 RepID=A0AAW4PGT9_9EURY|nr:enolase C-terminal domain-like protein [Halomicroarcula nitratireducens]MBX0297044.1 hypothetical protein [Halomicroarcula nitratireducens]